MRGWGVYAFSEPLSKGSLNGVPNRNANILTIKPVYPTMKSNTTVYKVFLQGWGVVIQSVESSS